MFWGGGGVVESKLCDFHVLVVSRGEQSRLASMRGANGEQVTAGNLTRSNCDSECDASQGDSVQTDGLADVRMGDMKREIKKGETATRGRKLDICRYWN